ncbi:MAG: hypothetical protein ABW054_05450 [Casimicrobiaceae bacterium]
MDIAALWLGWMLVWAFGVAVIAALRKRSAAPVDIGELAFVTGAGWFLGQFLLTVWMRLLSLAGVPFSLAAIGGPLAVATAAAVFAAWPGYGAITVGARSALHEISGAVLPAARRALWLALLAWLALRLLLLLVETTLRPLYPWDAWTQWATKAQVWYALKSMAPFVGASEWLAAPTGSVYFDAAPHYPATIPLTQVWSAILLGRFDDALVNLPWWLTALAFGIAVYGFLRLRKMSPIGSLIGTWVTLSLPILDAHVALAGYADLAMAAYLTMAMLAWLRYAQTRTLADLALALALCAACVVIKNPGKIWVVLLLPGIVAAFLPRHGLRFAIGFFAVAAIAALVMTQTGLNILGYQARLSFRMPWHSLAEAYFLLGNWHLLFYGAIAMALLGWRHLLTRDLAPLTITVAGGLAFLALGFGFTNAGAWVEDQSTVNRATLHLAPLIALWMIMTFRAWAEAQEVAVRQPA